MTGIAFSRTDATLGQFDVRPVDPIADAELLHGWLTHPKSAFWLMQDASVADVRRYFDDITVAEGREAFLGHCEGKPGFLVERYDPATDEIATVYPTTPGDVGMHVLVSPSDDPVRGFTRAVIVTVMELLFSDPTVTRVVVEPDVRNRAVHAVNARAGFTELATVPLGEKQALLSTCTRAQFHASPYRNPREHRG